MTLSTTLAWTRPAAVAGTFYPEQPEALKALIESYLEQARAKASVTAEAGATGTDMPGAGQADASSAPVAIIGPHAGYMYSGPVAASAYARLEPARGAIERVVLIGPSHRVAFSGLAASSAESFDTPLGRVRLDRQAIADLLELPQVHVIDEAHEREHSLEVHLPFLIGVLGADDGVAKFTLVPLAMGDVSSDEVAQVLAKLWGETAEQRRRTLIVVSSDLSHYHSYDAANKLDRATSRAIEALAPQDVGYEQACGRVAIQALLRLARQYGLRARTVDQRNSGDTGGKEQRRQGRSEVVGYGAYIFV